MNESQRRKAQWFHAQHTAPGCFVIPNAWDAGVAKMLAAAGFGAIATTSAGIAFSHGCPDYTFAPGSARMDRERMIERVAAIAAAIPVPLSADLEAGYGGTPEEVARTVRLAIDAGAVGGNIEDATGEEAAPLFDAGLAAERIKAAREAIAASGIAFVLVARTDPFLVRHPDAFAESVKRANLLRAAGADCIFVPGVSDRQTIACLVQVIDAPLNIVMGLTGAGLSLQELKELGVRRVSIGASLARALYLQIRRAAQEMLEQGTFGFAREQIPQDELNRIMLAIDGGSRGAF